MEFIKKNYKYIFLFIFFFLCLNFFFTLNKGDTYVNYGFSYAISNGEIPYKDFNIVITPFAPLFYSLFLIISKSIVSLYLGQALLLTIFYYFVEMLLGKKSILFLLCMIIPYPIAFSSTLFPGYNFLLLLLLIILFYLESNRKSDLLIGIIIGLMFCTKQTIGLIMFIPCIYYLFKNKTKFFVRSIGFLIPCFIFTCYLLFTGAFSEFINLCFLGLFDFGSSNSSCSLFYLVLSIIGFLYIIFCIIKNKKDITLYYGLLFVFIIYPLIDFYHVSLFLLLVMFFVIRNITVNKDIKKYVFSIICFITLLWGFVTIKYLGGFSVSDINNFELSVFPKNYYSNIKKINKYTNSLDKEVIFLMRGSENYMFKIMNNKAITYYDLPNRGNYGFNGNKKILASLNKKEDCYFVIDKVLLKDNSESQQYIKELGEMVVSDSTLVKTIGIYEIYYKE